MNRFAFLLVPLLGAILTACPSQPTLPSVVIAPSSGLTLPIGAGQLMYATVTDSSGKTVWQDVTWASSDPSKATIGTDGTVIGLALGDTNITASAGGITSRPVKVTVGKLPKGVATLSVPTAQNPSATEQLPVVVYKDYALYQGDIIFPLSSVQVATQGWSSAKPLSNIQPAQKGKLWPNKTLPFYLDPSLPQEIKDKVAQAVNVYRDKAAITLLPLSSPGGDYVYVSLADPAKPICGDSRVGRQGGQQDIHFAPGCPLRAYLHEFGHALGLWHEQSRNDRDSNITVLKNNIVDDYQDQYDKSGGEGAGYGPYDFGSVMHYPITSSVSKMSGGQPLPTFSVKRFYTPADEITQDSQIGRRDVLSGGDLKALSSLYGNIPPSITLVSPVGNTTQIEISNQLGLQFEAKASDVEDGNACCTLTWYAWKEGVIGSGPQINPTFKTLGTQLVTVTAEDSQGASDFVTFAVNVVHAKPNATISSPTVGTVYRNKTFQLQKTPNLAQDAAWDLKCTWTIPGLGSNPTGCSTNVLLGNSFPKGPLTITLNVTDKFGGANSSTVNLNVDELLTLGASITDPANNASALVGDSVFMRSVVVNGQTPVKKVWTWQASKQGCAPQTLTLKSPLVVLPGLIPDGIWDTSNQLSVPGDCGFDNNGGTLTVTVTDSNSQTASDSIPFKLSYVPPPN